MLLVILYTLAATYLAIYGIHVLLLVVQYWRHRHDRPRTIDLVDYPDRHGAAAVVQRTQRRRAHHRRGGQPRLAARSLADSGAGRFDRSHDGAGSIARGVPSSARPRHRGDPSQRSQRLQGGRAGQRIDLGQGRVRGDLRCGLHARAGFPAEDDAAFRRQLDRVCAGPLGSSPHLVAVRAADWRSAWTGISSSSRRRAIDRACR